MLEDDVMLEKMSVVKADEAYDKYGARELE